MKEELINQTGCQGVIADFMLHEKTLSEWSNSHDGFMDYSQFINHCKRDKEEFCKEFLFKMFE